MTDRAAFLAQLAAAGITPDKRLHVVLVTAYDVGEGARAALSDARLVDQKTATALVQRLATSADATVKTAARSEVRAQTLRLSAVLAAAGIALLALGELHGEWRGHAAGMAAASVTVIAAPTCAAEKVRESQGGLWCFLGPAQPRKTAAER